MRYPFCMQDKINHAINRALNPCRTRRESGEHISRLHKALKATANVVIMEGGRLCRILPLQEVGYGAKSGR